MIMTGETVLTINAGSSSVKFTLFRVPEMIDLCSGLVERIGSRGTRFHYGNHRGDRFSREAAVRDTTDAVREIDAAIHHPDHGVLDGSGKERIGVIGHRVVHGGEQLTESVLIDTGVKDIIRDHIRLAPLHNPPNLKGIEAGEQVFPGVPQVAVFDTAFHATMPDHAHLYGLPREIYRRYGVRRYGFHGISHKYVVHEASRIVRRPLEELKIISCHLGNGCSITAVDGGRSIDTSMGFTPLEGLIMGTRCGDIDPAVVPYLVEQMGVGLAGVMDLLNKKSGLMGMADIGSNDLRDILKARDEGNRMADAAMRAFCYRVKKYIGAYVAVLGRVDVLVFTAGIGENSPQARAMICAGLDDAASLAIVVDEQKNRRTVGCSGAVHGEASRVQVLVVKTWEEKEIAAQALEVVGTLSR